MSRMYERFDQGQLAVGAILPVHGHEWLEILGYAGFDFLCIDLMVSSLDWSDVAVMVLAAKRYDVTPWVRLSAFPWSSTNGDSSLQGQVLRALSLGAECVLASVNGPEQVQRMMEPLSNAHRRFYIQQGHHQGGGRTARQSVLDAAEPEQRVFPCLESLAAVDQLDDILQVPGLKMIYLGMGDLSRELGHPSDDQHPEVRTVVREIATKAQKQNIVVCANTLSYSKSQDLQEQIVSGVAGLWELGVRAIMIPRPTMIVQRFYETTLAKLETRVPGIHD